MQPTDVDHIALGQGLARSGVNLDRPVQVAEDVGEAKGAGSDGPGKVGIGDQIDRQSGASRQGIEGDWEVAKAIPCRSSVANLDRLVGRVVSQFSCGQGGIVVCPVEGGITTDLNLRCH